MIKGESAPLAPRTNARWPTLEKAGFAREGVLKGWQYRAGGWHDLVVLARIRG